MFGVCGYSSTPPKTNMEMVEQQFQNVSPNKNGDVPLPCQFSGGLVVTYSCILCNIISCDVHKTRVFQCP